MSDSEPPEDDEEEQETETGEQLDDGSPVAPGEGEAGLGFGDGSDHNTEIGGIEYIDDVLDDSEPADMTIGNVHVRGTVRTEESGSGYTEEYKSERERESGGEDSVDEPPAAELTVEAWGTQTDWEQLNSMREARDPFPVSIGPFVFEEVGIANVEQTIRGKHGPAAREFMIELQEFREMIVQRQSVSEALGGSEDAPGTGTPGDVSGPQAGDVEYDGTPTTVSGTQTFRVGDNETFGGELIDAGSGGDPDLTAQGNGWVIENVGLTGTHRGSNAGGTGDDFIVAQTNGGSAAIRHLYAAEGGSNVDTGIFIHANSSGSMEIRRTNIQGWPDNACYMADPLSSGMQVEVVDAYHAGNGTSQFRGPNNLLVNNCVGAEPMSHGPRGVWKRGGGGTIELRDTHIYCPGSGAVVIDGGSVVAEGDTHIEGGGSGQVSGSPGSSADPNAYHSDIPGSAAEAAQGVGQSGGDNGGGGDDE